MDDILLLHIKRTKLLQQQRLNMVFYKEASKEATKRRHDDYMPRVERAMNQTTKQIEDNLKQIKALQL